MDYSAFQRRPGPGFFLWNFCSITLFLKLITCVETLPKRGSGPSDYFCTATSHCVYIFGGGTYLTVLGQSQSPPTVHLFPPSKEEMASKNKATLVCLLGDFYPGAFQVTWQAGGTTISNGVETTKATKVNNKYAASSYLTMTSSDWESYPSVSCKVRHEGSNYEKSVSHSQCP